MKPFTRPILRPGIAGTAFTLLASLALAGPASAAKGGKDGGKPGGDEDPPPFYYVVNWIGDETEGNNRNYYRLNDVTSDGTVVGQFWPLRDYGERHAVVVFPDGEMVDIEALLLAEGVVVPGTRVTTAFGVTEDLLMGVDLWDPSGQFMTGALQLDASRGIAAFAVFADPVGLGAFATDVTESGVFLVAVSDLRTEPGSDGGISIGSPATMFSWDPVAGTAVENLGQVAGGSGLEGWFESKLSDYPAAILGGTVIDLVAGAPIALPDPGTTVTPIQLGADGTVVANIAGAPIRKNRTAPPTLARWRPGDQQWETIITRGSAARVNSTGEIAVTASGELSVFQDDYGLLSVDDLIHPDQAGSWNKNATIMLRGLSDPLPGDSTGGAVLGMADGGTIGPHFVLIPDPAKAP